MKINELLNEENQVNEFGWFKKDPAQQMIDKYLPGFMDKWTQYMALAQRANTNYKDPAYRIKILGQMLNYYIKPNRTELIALNRMIKNSGNNITNDAEIKKIASAGIAMALQKRIAPQKQKSKKVAKATTAATPATATPATEFVVFNSKAGPVRFNFDGTNWFNEKGNLIKIPATIAKLNAELAKKRSTANTTSGTTP